MDLHEHLDAAQRLLQQFPAPERGDLVRGQARIVERRLGAGLDPATGRRAPPPMLGASLASEAPKSEPLERPNFSVAPASDERRARAQVLLAALPAEARDIALDGPELPGIVAGGAAKVAAARRAFAAAANQTHQARLGHVVLVGPAGSGKTALAAAWLRSRILEGAWSAWFVPSIEIGEERQSTDGRRLTPWAQLAEDAEELVLDDLGAELTGAPIAGGLAAQRMEAIHLALHRRKQRGASHVITTPHEKPVLARIYGDGIARRVFEGAALVRLGAPS